VHPTISEQLAKVRHADRLEHAARARLASEARKEGEPGPASNRRSTLPWWRMRFLGRRQREFG
jgi:hypothetical protein